MNYTTIFIIIAIILILYACCYYIQPSSIVILQTTLSEFNFNLLLQKQPLVIGDKIIKINDLIKSWFSPNIISVHDFNIKNINNWILNKNKYLLLHSNENTEVLLLQGGKKLINNEPSEKETILAIKLYENQSLIVPFRWYYYCNTTNIKCFEINDYISIFLKVF